MRGVVGSKLRSVSHLRFLGMGEELVLSSADPTNLTVRRQSEYLGLLKNLVVSIAGVGR